VENLSTLFETLLLPVTCAWILWSAVHRLAALRLDIEVTLWPFAVIATSIWFFVAESTIFC